MDYDLMPIGGGYPTESPAGMFNAKMAHAPTIKQRIEAAVARAEEQLAAAKRARELFDKNPDLEELLNLMQKSHF